jgi:hypothetical protein
VNKFKFYLDFEKEEKWLNQMAKEGWELNRKPFGYQFREAIPNDTIIKIDYRCFKTNEDFGDYRTLFRDSGWEHIAGTKLSGTQYFKKVNEYGDADIFSDIPSKAARYKKLSNMWLTMAFSYIPIFFVLFTAKTIDIAALLNPKLLYYTPGLWEKTKISFWRAFLFETPFAMMRGFSWLFFPALIILYFVFAMRAEKNYRRVNCK